MAVLNVAWWNLENLFDHEDAQRPSALKSTLKNELKGWSAKIRDRKIDQIASVVEMMFDGSGPDLLGLCEVENERVVSRLGKAIRIATRDYQVVSHESPDARGMDVSFLIDTKKLSVKESHHQVIMKRSPTRDLFWCRFQITGGPAFVAIANHWPSRTAGQYKSEPFRMLTGETLAHVIAGLLCGNEGDAALPLIVMGDFNDEPFSRSMQEYLLGTRDPGRVRYSRSGHLFNLMWPLMQGHDPGTYLFESDWYMLDQFLVSYGALRRASPLRVEAGGVAVFRPDVLAGKSGKPRRFGRPSRDSLDVDGFSDHFPITMVLTY